MTSETSLLPKNNMKPIFFTSDWHVGHENSIKFDSRPFKDLSHMHRVLINNYNSCVPDNGLCYFLGDMGFGNKEVLKDVVSSLNGTKVLILGNHDGGINSMYGVGFDVVLHQAAFYLSKELITMTHCPLRGIRREYCEEMKGYKEGDLWHGESKQTMYSIDPHTGFHLHGHIHSPNKGRSQKILGRQMDVGVVANGYRPVSISEILSWMVLTKRKEQG